MVSHTHPHPTPPHPGKRRRRPHPLERRWRRVGSTCALEGTTSYPLLTTYYLLLTSCQLLTYNLGWCRRADHVAFDRARADRRQRLTNVRHVRVLPSETLRDTAPLLAGSAQRVKSVID